MSRRVLLLLAATSLLATACLKVNLDIEVRDDGSANLNGIIALNVDALDEVTRGFGTSRDELCSGFLEETDFGSNEETPDLDIKSYTEDGFCGVEFTGDIPADVLENQIAAVGGAQDLTIRRQGDGWFFELPLGDAALGTEGLDDFGGLFDLDELLEDAEYIMRVKLPGRQIDHNADFIESDGTMVWEIDLLNPPERIFLQTEPGETITGSGGGGGSSTGAILLIVGLALAALGAAAYFLMRNKRQAKASPSPTVGPLGDSAATAPVTSPPVQDFVQTAQTMPQAEDVAPDQAVVTPQPAPQPEPSSQPNASTDPQVIASPTPEQATGAPVWDPARRQYVQWDPDGNRWLAYNDDAKAWQPE